MISAAFIRACWTAGIRWNELCLQYRVNQEMALLIYGEMELGNIVGWHHKQPRAEMQK